MSNCLSKIQLVGAKKYNMETKHLVLVKARLKSFFVSKINITNVGGFFRY